MKGFRAKEKKGVLRNLNPILESLLIQGIPEIWEALAVNDDGESLVEFCVERDLVTVDICLRKIEIHKYF